MDSPMASIPDQSGKRAIVTGANSGIGFSLARALASAGAAVTLACRDRRRGTAALERIREDQPKADVRLAVLDLASLASISSFAESWDGPLDLLVNNAGVMATARAVTEDGFEQQLGINHLGHFALGGLLLPALRQVPGSRVVVLSSLAHRRGHIDFDDLNSASSYRRWRAYSQSKIANLYYAMEFARRIEGTGEDLVVVAAHPGVASTNLAASMGLNPMALLTSLYLRLAAQSAEAGALPGLHAATAPDVHGGDFFGPNGPGGLRGSVAQVAPAAHVADLVVARRLWDASEQLTGVVYPSLPPLPD